MSTDRVGDLLLALGELLHVAGHDGSVAGGIHFLFVGTGDV